MLDTAFPRNADGTLKTKEGCKTPDCRYPNWHICSGPTAPDIELMPKPNNGGGTNFFEKFEQDPTRRERVTAGHRERLARERTKADARNENIVKERSAGASYLDLSRKYALAESSVRAIVSRAKA